MHDILIFKIRTPNEVDIILYKCFIVISLVLSIPNKIKPNLQKKMKISCFNIYFHACTCEPNKIWILSNLV